MSAETVQWVEDYVKLRETERELKTFIERYDAIIRQIAHAHAEALHEPCRYCRVHVSTLLDSMKGWYFEWTCYGHATPHGRCAADTFGWYVGMDVIHEELERALAAIAAT